MVVFFMVLVFMGVDSCVVQHAGFGPRDLSRFEQEPEHGAVGTAGQGSPNTLKS
jgi:hypothetical protein